MSVTVTFSDAEVNLVRQALRAEEERLTKAGYKGLAEVTAKARDTLSNAMLDKKVLLV